MTARLLHIGCLCVAVLLPDALALAAREPAIRRTDERLSVTLANGVTLTFALADGLLLGLNRAQVEGVDLTSRDTCLRPYLAQEFAKDRMIWPLMRLKDVHTRDGRVRIECDLLGTTDEKAFRRLFVFTGDRERALLPENMTPELKALKEKAEAAEAALHAACLADAGYAEAHKKLEDLEAQRSEAKEAARILRLESEIKRAEGKVQELAKELGPALLAESETLRHGRRDIRAFEEELDKCSLMFGKVHRDFYRFAHTRLPAEICGLRFLKKQAEGSAKECLPRGTLNWIIEPLDRNIAGWKWSGWKQHYEFSLPKGRKVNVVRQFGTWELDGKADGLTVVNVRYRGLGRIEQALTSAGPGKGVKEAWSTTEIMPGAVGESMVISPAIPETAVRDLSDRNYALLHRASAWICHMARGAGHGFVDFQYRPHAALASFPERQGSLRALTEIFPGDACVSQTDVEFFAQAESHATIPQVYLALVTKDKALARHESRTRWQEVDQYVRDLVSEELGLVQYEVLPGVGILSDVDWAGHYKRLAEAGLDGWADKGVRLVAYHNPGWINGRYQGPDGPPKTGGGVCNIYDWWPTKDVEEPWKAFMRACGRRGVAFYPWLGQTIWRDAPFAKRVGLEPGHWALNAPGDSHGAGYGPMNMKGNMHDARFRQVFLGQLEDLRREFGYQGFWGDSFQNLFMSQLDWANGTGDSMQRKWWEQIAAWSRQGVGWMAESHAFPGLSCSIEVPGWEKDYWFFQHVWRWYRGNEQSRYGAEELDRLCFRVMANKGWTAPDHSYKTDANFAIPAFKRLAHEYLAALPQMRRSFILPGEEGVLWLPFTGEGRGVWFAFSARDVPEGVTAAYVLDKKPVAETRAHHTYSVEADDLPKRFGVRRGPLEDPRVGRQYEAAAYTWPDWAKE